jgi:hypothetical protein
MNEGVLYVKQRFQHTNALLQQERRTYGGMARPKNKAEKLRKDKFYLSKGMTMRDTRARKALAFLAPRPHKMVVPPAALWTPVVETHVYIAPLVD